MPLDREIWAKDIQDALRENNAFLAESIDESEFVNGTVVSRAHAGADPKTTKNRTVFPVPINTRTDTKESYNIDRYSTEAIRIGNIDEAQANYPLRQSILKSHTDVLQADVAMDIMHAWAPTSGTRFIRTSGASGTANGPTGATGARKKITLEDLAYLHKILDDDNLGREGRNLLMDTMIYAELFGISDLVRADSFGSALLPNGAVKRVMGWDIFVKPTVITYDATGTPALKAVGADVASTDHRGVLAWHRSYVAKALGDINIYLNENDAAYQGTIISADVAFGGAKVRQTTQKGVAALIQAAA
jgi:hypothetical protein